MKNQFHRIERLPESRWSDCRDLRLEALREEPLAFGSSYDEERLITERGWRDRINNAIFALDNNMPTGMVVLVCETTQKTKHIGNIYGLFVKQTHRGLGIGNQLIENAIQELKELEPIRKIKLAVNSEKKAAIALYDKLGFKVAGTLKKEIKYDNKYYDELIMELLF